MSPPLVWPIILLETEVATEANQRVETKVNSGGNIVL